MLSFWEILANALSSAGSADGSTQGKGDSSKSKSQRSVGEENCAGRTGSSSLHFDLENVGFSGYKLGKIYAQLSHLYNPRLLVMNIT